MASKAIGFLNFKFSADLTSFERAMKKAQKKLKKFGSNLKKTGKNMTMGLTAPIVGLGVASLKTFADFEQGMLKVKAISGATDSQFKALTDSAKKLGSTTMFTASQVAELQLNLSKLGFDPQSILDSSQAILNLAQATDSDLAQAATVAASTMNAFGLEAKDMTMISDVMADAFSSSALDLEKFQTAMASVAPVAREAGQDIQGTSAILGVLVNNGVEASTAGTALRNIFLDLAANGMTWSEAMDQINNASVPLNAAMDLFGKRGANVATIIGKNGTEIQNLTADFNDSAGEAKGMADIMDSGVGGAFRKLKSQLEGAGIELGEKLVPIFTKFGEKLKELIKWFTDLSPQQQENIVKWAAIVAALGPVLWILGQLIIVIGGISKALMFLAANPVVLIIGAIVALGIAIYKVMTGTSKFAVTVRNAFKSMVNGIIWILNKMIGAFNYVSKKLGGPTISKIKELKKETYKAKDSVEEMGDAAEKTGEQIVETTEKISAYNEIQGEAEKSTQKEAAEVAALTYVLKDEDATRQQQIDSLKKLKEISPKYFGDVRIGVSTVEDITRATENYTKALLEQAKIEAVKGKIAPLLAELVELEIASKKMKENNKAIQKEFDESDSIWDFAKDQADKGEGVLEKTVAVFSGFTRQIAGRQFDLSLGPINIQPFEIDVLGGQKATIQKQIDEYTELIQGMDLSGIITTQPKGKGGGKTKTSPFEIDIAALEKNHQLALNKLKETQLIEQKSDDDFNKILESEESKHLNNMWNLYNKYGKDVTDLDGEILDKLLSNQEKLSEDPFANYRNSLGKLGETIAEFTGTELSELEVGLAEIVQSLGDELAQGAEDFETYGKNVLGVLKDIIGGLISAGVAAAVSKALKDSAFLPVWAIPVIAGAAAGLAKTAFNTLIPEFAEGGIVTGPTTALIGEGSGTSMANPEVVAPLDKLKQYMGGGQNVTVTGRLVGNDIYLSNERTKFNRNRTV